MENGYIVSVTFAEFLVWLNSGELRLPTRRLLPAGVHHEGYAEADQVVRKQLINLLPHIDLEDEHSIIIVTLSGQFTGPEELNNVLREHEPYLRDMIYAPFSAILSVQPLTRRGGEILESRLEAYSMRMEKPLFEEEANGLWLEWSYRRSVRGAFSLLDLLVKNPEYKPSSSFIRSAQDGLKLLNAGRQPPSPTESLVAQLLCYSRHKTIPDSDNGFFADLGLILSTNSKALATDSLIDTLRNIWKNITTDTRSLPQLLSDESIRNALSIYVPKDIGDIDLHSAVLFLKWKHQTQLKGSLQFDDILNDVKDCASRVSKHRVSQAIWLLGFFWGFDRMANEYYARSPANTSLFSRHLPNEPVELLPLTHEAPSPLPPPTKKTRAPRKKKSSILKEVSAETQNDSTTEPTS